MRNVAILCVLGSLVLFGVTNAQPLCSFEDLTTGSSVEGLGTACPFLAITSVNGVAVVIETGVGPPATYGGPQVGNEPNGAGPGPSQLNNCLEDANGSRVNVNSSGGVTAKGFGDSTAPGVHVQEYDFTFASGKTVSEFALRMFDYGDFNIFRVTVHSMVLTAYNASNVPVASDTLYFTSDSRANPRTGSAGDLFVTGDACDAAADLSQPGYHEFRVQGSGITRLELRVPAGGDSNVGFDSIDFICESEACADPNPLTQGYWHRQCLGLSVADGGIDPSRHGRGPQFPIEPDFDKLLQPVSDALFDKVFDVRACQDGIDTNPPSDQCEKAKKQLTALLFNLESGRLSVGCTVTAAECLSTNVGDAIDEIAALINSLDPDNCNAAKACAAAINEGAVTEFSSLDMPMSLDATAVSMTPFLGSRGSVGETTDVTMGAEAATPAAKASSVIFLEGEARDVEVEQHAEPDVVETDDLLGSLERHTAVLNNPSAPEAALEVSEDALLTALSGGYEPEVRIEIVGVLIDHVDVALHDLLIRHLENLRDEAQDFEKDELVAQAERLLKRLESDRE